MIPSKTVLDMGPVPHVKGTFGGRKSKFALQIAAKLLQIAECYREPIRTQQRHILSNGSGGARILEQVGSAAGPKVVW